MSTTTVWFGSNSTILSLSVYLSLLLDLHILQLHLVHWALCPRSSQRLQEPQSFRGVPGSLPGPGVPSDLKRAVTVFFSVLSGNI